MEQQHFAAATATNLIVKAANFAAIKHRDQKRKDKDQSPYINHPLGCAEIATSLGGVSDPAVIAGCMLHDTVEDTDTTHEELVETFGPEVADIVKQVTDDKTLSKDKRKRAQVVNAPKKTPQAKLVKLCDKLYNLRDLIANPPPSYSIERIQGYCIFAKLVVDGLRGTNAAIEQALDDEIFNASFTFKGETYMCCPPRDQIDEKHIFPTNTTYVHDN